MRETIHWLLDLLAPFRWRVLLGSMLVALTVLGNVGLLATSGQLLSQAALQPELLLLMPLITGVRFFGIGRAVVRYAERLMNHSIAFRILGRLRKDFYDHLEPLVPDAMPNYAEGKLYNQFVTDINVLQYFYLKAVSIPLGSVMIYTVCALFLAFFEPALIPLLLVGQVLAGVCVPIIAVRSDRRGKRDTLAVADTLSMQFLDFKNGLADLHLYGQLASTQNHLSDAARRLTLLHARMSMKKKMVSRLTFALSHLTMLAALWLLASAVQSGRLAGVDVAMLALLVLASFEAVLQMPEAVLQMEESLAAAKELRSVYETPSPEQQERTETPQGWDIEAEQLCFHYHQDGRQFIDNLSMRIPQGQHIAIVGESGSGKSSLVRLFSGLWRPDGGSVRLGGTQISAIAEGTLHHMVASVDQESYFFYATIRENMQLAKSDVQDDAIWQALEMVELDDIVKALPDGLSTVLAENATIFSGGQRQRLAIARMIVQDPHVVILDEALQKLDKGLAERIFARLIEWGSGRTMIVVSHSLTMLDKLDFSYVLAYGKIIEQGTHAALLAKTDGHYRALYDIEQSQF